MLEILAVIRAVSCKWRQFSSFNGEIGVCGDDHCETQVRGAEEYFCKRLVPSSTLFVFNDPCNQHQIAARTSLTFSRGTVVSRARQCLEMFAQLVYRWI